jgi:hypothetical protein
MTPYKIVAAEVKSEGLRYELLLNGGAVLREQDPAQRAAMAKLNPYVLSAQNRLEVAIAPPLEEDTPGLGASLQVIVLEGEHGKAPPPEGRLLEWAWSPSDTPVSGPGFTPVLQFDLPTTVDHGQWAWQRAVPYTDADRLAVEALASRFRSAVVARDAGGVLALTTLRTADMSRALDVPEAELTRLQSDGLADLFGAQDFQVSLFDTRSLVLRPRAGGRLVEVTYPVPPPPGARPGAFAEGPAIRVFAQGRVVPFGLTVSQIDGVWTIVR